MTLFAAAIDGLDATGRYAPDFRIEVEGVELSPETKGDVLELKVTMDMDNMASAEVKLNNWDDTRVWFKYSDKKGLYVGNRVHIQMGYAEHLVSMLRGRINSINPTFPNSGSPTVTLGVLDYMQLLKNRKPKKGEDVHYNKKTDGEIAALIAQRNGLTPDVDTSGIRHDEVIQKNQDDAQFLMERAKRKDFDCYIFADPETQESILRFKPPSDERDGSRVRQHKFTWGETLKNFSPSLTMSSQVSKVTVRDWDDDNKVPIEATATAKDLPGGNANSGPAIAGDAVSGRQEVVVDAPVLNKEEARELAISLLRERAYEFITGSGEIIGSADMRPGDNLVLSGLGDRFSGSYYVKKVEHIIGDSGYSTKFQVRKFYDGGAK